MKRYFRNKVEFWSKGGCNVAHRCVFAILDADFGIQMHETIVPTEPIVGTKVSRKHSRQTGCCTARNCSMGTMHPLRCSRVRRPDAWLLFSAKMLTTSSGRRCAKNPRTTARKHPHPRAHLCTQFWEYTLFCSLFLSVPYVFILTLSPSLRSTCGTHERVE